MRPTDTYRQAYRLPELLGATVIVFLTFATEPLGLLPTDFIYVSAFIGGGVAGALTVSGDAAPITGLVAGLFAAPLLILCNVVDKFLLTARYDIVMTTLGRTPDGFVDQLLVYTVYETITGLVVVLPNIFIAMAGSWIGYKLLRLVVD